MLDSFILEKELNLDLFLAVLTHTNKLFTLDDFEKLCKLTEKAALQNLNLEIFKITIDKCVSDLLMQSEVKLKS